MPLPPRTASASVAASVRAALARGECQAALTTLKSAPPLVSLRQACLATDQSLEPLLHAAVRLGSTSLVRALLERGAPADAEYAGQGTALDVAQRACNLPICMLLVQTGSDTAAAMQRIRRSVMTRPQDWTPRGHAWAWGTNDTFQLGVSGDGRRSLPSRVRGIASRHVLAVATSQQCSAAVTGDGHGYVWGILGHGEHQCVLPEPLLVPGLPDAACDPVCNVAAAKTHVLFLTRTGAVYSYGDRSSDRARVLAATGISSIACGSGYSLLVRADSGLDVCGRIDGVSYPAPTPCLTLQGRVVCALGAADTHAALVLRHGSGRRVYVLPALGQSRLGRGIAKGFPEPVRVRVATSDADTPPCYDVVAAAAGTLPSPPTCTCPYIMLVLAATRASQPVVWRGHPVCGADPSVAQRLTTLPHDVRVWTRDTGLLAVQQDAAVVHLARDARRAALLAQDGAVYLWDPRVSAADEAAVVRVFAPLQRIVSFSLAAFHALAVTASLAAAAADESGGDGADDACELDGDDSEGDADDKDVDVVDVHRATLYRALAALEPTDDSPHPHLADATLVSSDGHERQVHRVILAAASPQMAALVADTQPNDVVPVPLPSQLLDILLAWAYHSVSSSSSATASRRLKAAQQEKLQQFGWPRAPGPVHQRLPHTDFLVHFQPDVADAETDKPAAATVSVHACVLAARCEPFAAMLRHACAESARAVLRLLHIPARIGRGLLHFLYTDSLPESADEQLAIDLLDVADEMLLPDLRALCQRFLVTCVCWNNASDLLYAACVYQCETLRAACVRLLLLHLDQVLVTRALDHTALAALYALEDEWRDTAGLARRRRSLAKAPSDAPLVLLDMAAVAQAASDDADGAEHSVPGTPGSGRRRKSKRRSAGSASAAPPAAGAAADGAGPVQAEQPGDAALLSPASAPTTPLRSGVPSLAQVMQQEEERRAAVAAAAAAAVGSVRTVVEDSTRAASPSLRYRILERDPLSESLATRPSLQSLMAEEEQQRKQASPQRTQRTPRSAASPAGSQRKTARRVASWGLASSRSAEGDTSVLQPRTWAKPPSAPMAVPSAGGLLRGAPAWGAPAWSMSPDRRSSDAWTAAGDSPGRSGSPSLSMIQSQQQSEQARAAISKQRGSRKSLEAIQKEDRAIAELQASLGPGVVVQRRASGRQ